MLEAESEEEEDPDRWVDEFGRKWLRSELFPGRWNLLSTGLDVDIIWEEPGLDCWGATRGASDDGVRLLLLVLRDWVWCWRVRLSGQPSYSEATKQPPCKAERGCQSTEAIGRISCPWCARAVCTWKIRCIIPLRPCIWQSFPRYLGVACGVRNIGFLGEMTLSGGAMLGSTVDTGVCDSTSLLDEFHTISTFDVDSDPEVFLSVLTQNGEVCLADASARSPLVRCSHLELWKLFSWHPRG